MVDKSPEGKENSKEAPNKFDKDDFYNSIHETSGPIGLKNSENDPEEYQHLRKILSAFFNYQVDSLRDVSRMERDFNSIDEKYKKRIDFDYKERIEKMKKAIWQNYTFLLKKKPIYI